MVDAAPSRRIRLSYSLRALIVVITMVALWCAFHANRGRYERSVERELTLAGAQVDSGLDRLTGKPRAVTSYEQFFRSLFGQRFIRRIDAHHTTALAPGLLERVWHLPHLESATFFSCQLTDRHLRSLGTATGLELLLLEEEKLTDEGLKGLDSLRQLRYAHLTDGDIGDATLRRLAQLPKLEGIDLWRTKITGKGVSSLACQHALIGFSAEDTPIQDDFLATLATCPNLRDLNLTRVPITDGGVAHFREHPSLCFVKLGVLDTTDASLEVASTIPKLKRFQMARGVTKEGVKKFRARRPDVRL